MEVKCYAKNKNLCIFVYKIINLLHLYLFVAIGSIHFRVFDVGGKKSQRKKWIHCFDNAQAKRCSLLKMLIWFLKLGRECETGQGDGESFVFANKPGNQFS